jgi:hypothetical protein
MVASRPPPPPQPTRRLTLPGLDLRAAATLGAAATLVAAGVLAWRFGAGPEERTVPVPSPPPPATTTTPSPPTKPGRDGSPALARLVVTAARGDCWLSIRAGSGDGRVLYEGTLREGHSLRFARKRLWVRIGAPWNLEARLNGRAIRGLPADTGNVLVTRAGVRPA